MDMKNIWGCALFTRKRSVEPGTSYYAHAYDLTRDELRYILDPKEVYGEDPSIGSGRRFTGETLRVVKEKEVKQFGNAPRRTKCQMLEAWDNLLD